MYRPHRNKEWPSSQQGWTVTEYPWGQLWTGSQTRVKTLPLLAVGNQWTYHWVELTLTFKLVTGQSVRSTPQSSPPTLKRCLKSASDLGSLGGLDSRKRSVQVQQPTSPTRSPTNSKLKSKSTFSWIFFFANRFLLNYFSLIATKSGGQVLL